MSILIENEKRFQLQLRNLPYPRKEARGLIKESHDTWIMFGS
jgi:hypothetical protein